MILEKPRAYLTPAASFARDPVAPLVPAVQVGRVERPLGFRPPSMVDPETFEDYSKPDYKTRGDSELPAEGLTDYLKSEHLETYHLCKRKDTLKEVSAQAFPPVCLTNIQRFVAENRHSGFNQHNVFSACLDIGTKYLAARPEIVEIIAARKRFDLISPSTPKAESTLIQQVIEWNPKLLEFPKGGRFNPRVDLTAYQRASDLSTNTGLSISQISTLAVMATLANQCNANDSDAEDMKRTVLKFVTLTGTLSKGAHALMDVFGL